MMTHILSKLPEIYKNILENIIDGLDDDKDNPKIERICENL